MSSWRWDQGRLEYFRYEALKKMAPVLVRHDGQSLGDANSNAKKELIEATGLPFSPDNYSVKRNYKRMLECSLLATFEGNNIIVSDICRDLASGQSLIKNENDYISELERRFRYPFPAFKNYSVEQELVFPFIAVSKLLISRAIKNSSDSALVSVDDVAGCLIANNVTGFEDLSFYLSLKKGPSDFLTDSERRQIRELIRVLGLKNSFSFNTRCGLSLSNRGRDSRPLEKQFDELIPRVTTLDVPNKLIDFLTIASADNASPTGQNTLNANGEAEFDANAYYQEGARHTRWSNQIERDPRVRSRYIELHPEAICEACHVNQQKQYPWTSYLLQIHHLFPLKSYGKKAISITDANDVVGLCPSCHAAIHEYYSRYLTDNSKNDFSSKEEALEVYKRAVKEMEKA